MILVDNSYIGQKLRRTRRTAKIKRNDAAKMLHIPARKLLKYECGKELIPESVLERLFYNAWAMMSVRNAQYRELPRRPQCEK